LPVGAPRLDSRVPDFNLDSALALLWQRLPGIARDLVARADYPPHPRNERFLANPDDPAEHETHWHQWGIITHSRMFEKGFVEEVPVLLRSWGVGEKVGSALVARVDDVPRSDLLRLAIPLHDLGKFAVRQVRLSRNNRVGVAFKHHEEESGRVIRRDLRPLLGGELGLTDAQFEYVAGCAERHYVLAHVRDSLKGSGAYDIAHVLTPGFGERCFALMRMNAGYELEVGLLWLADSLAKNGGRVQAETDEELAAKDAEVRAVARQLVADRDLYDSVRQVPVNVAVARVYLQLWAACRA
jgi:hypothetical protein